jgi:hypothetical protein
MDVGIFVLSETISNPCADRRTKHEWALASQWEAGWKFLVQHEPDRGGQSDSIKIYSMRRTTGRTFDRVLLMERADGSVEPLSLNSREDAKRSASFLALLAALKPSTDPYDDFRWAFYSTSFCDPHDDATDVLWALFRAGKVTAADIRLALAARADEPIVP